MWVFVFLVPHSQSTLQQVLGEGEIHIHSCHQLGRMQAEASTAAFQFPVKVILLLLLIPFVACPGELCILSLMTHLHLLCHQNR